MTCFVSAGQWDEVPLPQAPFLALDDQQRLARQHEEILLVGLRVIHRHRLTGREHEEAGPDLGKLGLALEGQASSPPLTVAPSRLASVEDEPPLFDARAPPR